MRWLEELEDGRAIVLEEEKVRKRRSNQVFLDVELLVDEKDRNKISKVDTIRVCAELYDVPFEA